MDKNNINSVKRGMFPLRKKHTKQSLKKDVKALRANGYPIHIALHTLDSSIKKKKTSNSKLKRGLIINSPKRYTIRKDTK